MKLPKDCLIFLKKAEQDETLLISIQDNPEISDSIFGFHAQQAAEKLIKAILVKKGIPFPKTHDLSMLLDLLKRGKITPPFSEDDLEWLTPYATIFRYDDLSEETLDRKKAIALISSIKKWANHLIR